MFLERATAMALVVARLGGFIVISPFPGSWMPQRVKVATVVTLAFVLGTALPGPSTSVVGAGGGIDVLRLAGLAASDFALGALVGASFRFFVDAAELMAGLVSQAAYLAQPIAFNPEMGGQSQILAQLASLLALLLILGTGTHRIVLGYLLASFTLLPSGVALDLRMGALSLVSLVGRSLVVGMQLAFPVVAVSLTVQAALALISRVAPSLQIFSIGFAVIVATGLLTFMASLPGIAVGMLDYFNGIAPFIDELMRTLGGLP
ncbi:MAG: flagellar biosynthetic protein FliR [Myxococcota bacterium]